ncbi:hypothetical protein PGB90_002246 [Kerria lacca]
MPSEAKDEYDKTGVKDRLITLLWYAECIMFHLPSNNRKCLREELKQNALISGEYEVSEAPNQRVDYVVTDSNGHIFSQKENISKGKFSFISETFDMFEICFISKVATNVRPIIQEVTLDVKTGVEAKSYEGIGEAAKLKPMELELKRLEDLTDSIVQDFADMKKREEELRNTNESTNNRVFYLSIFSIFILLALPAWQMLYLRQYFKSKKLIE